MKPFKATGDISFVKTGGNTDVTTLGLSDKAEWKTSSRFTLKQEFSWVYGDDENVISTNALLAGIRGEYGFLITGPDLSRVQLRLRHVLRGQAPV